MSKHALIVAVLVGWITGCAADSVGGATPDTVGDTSPDGRDEDVPEDVPDGGPEPTDPVCEDSDAPLVMQLGGALDDEVVALTGTAKRLWIGGYENGRVGIENIDPVGRAYGFVRTLDAAGAVKGEWKIDSGSTDSVEALTLEDGVSDATVLVLGRTTGALVGTSHGAWDGYVARIDRASGLEPLLQFGSERPQHPRTLTRRHAGWLIGGYDDTYVPSNYVEAWGNPMYALVDDALDEVTLRTWDTPSDDVSPGAASSDDLPGASFVGWQRGANPAGGPHVSRLDDAGVTVWDNHLAAVAVDGIGGVQVVDGEVVAAGSSFMTLGDKAFGQQDAFVVWLDPDDGAVLDAVQIGSSESDWVSAMIATADGRVHLVGETNGSIDGVTQNAGDSDIFVVTIGPDHRVERVWQRGTPGYDKPMAIAVGPCGRLFVAGSTDGAFVAGGAHGGRDGFVLEVR